MILKPILLPDFSAKAEYCIGVFGSEKWLSIYGDSLKLIGIYKDEHQLIGGFYYLDTKKFGFRFLKLPPYTPHCGLFFTTNNKNQASLNNTTKDIMNELCAYFLNQKSALTILALPSLHIDLQPFIWNNFKIIPNYTYQINLQQSIESIKSNFDPKNRNAINKALKQPISITENTLSKDALFVFFRDYLQTTNANIYETELKNIFHLFADSSNSFSVEAYQNEKVLGLVFCIYDKQNCYYLLGAVNKGENTQGINNLLVQKSIEKAKELGCTTFDFEGSMIKGVEKFFRSFGGELTPYYTVNKANLLLEMALKFKKRSVF